MRLRHRVRTAAPPAVVWEALGDPERWPEFMPTLKRVRGAHGPAQAGQRLLAVSRTPLGLRIPVDVLEAEPGVRLVVRSHTLPGVTEQTTFVLTRTTRGGTDVSVSTVVDGLFALPAVIPVWAALGITARVLALRTDRSAKAVRRAGAA